MPTPWHRLLELDSGLQLFHLNEELPLVEIGRRQPVAAMTLSLDLLIFGKFLLSQDSGVTVALHTRLADFLTTVL